MAVSIQFHKYTGRPKQEHNRNTEVRQKEAHIRGEDEGGWIEVWHDESWKKAVDERIFGADIAEFNSRQTRKDRMKTSYYAECVEREKLDDEKNLMKIQEDKNGVFRPVHEFVVGIYGTDATQEQKIEILREFYENFKMEYSNFEIVGAYLHVDEQSDLVRSGEKTLDEVDPHLHLDVVPVAHNFKRGMQNQISMSGAIKELGLFKVNKRQNELVQFEEFNRQLLKTLCKERGFEAVITQEGEKEHKEKDIFILDKKKEQAQQKLAEVEEKKEVAEIQLSGIEEEKEFAEMELSSSRVIIENQKKQINELQSQMEVERMEFNNELIQKQLELEQANEAIEKAEQKINKIRSDANTEIEELKQQRDDLQNKISEIIKNNQLSDDDVDDISRSMERVLTEAVKGGERIERNGYSAADKSLAENELIAKCMDDMQSPFNKIKEHCNKLTEKVKERIEYWRQSVETARIVRTGGIEAFTGKDGRVSEQGKAYIERQIRSKLSERSNDESWNEVRNHYRTLSEADREKLVQKLVQNSVDYAEDSCVDKSAKYVHKSKLDKVIDKSAASVSRGIMAALQQVKQMQEQYLDEMER